MSTPLATSPFLAVAPMLTAITPVILTYNEAPNIDRTLQQITWAQRIVVVDSYSTDETLEILARYPQVEVLQRTFDTHAQQWNYGLAQVQTPWVLSLDADYCVSAELLAEMAALDPDGPINSYWIAFQFCIFGKPLRGSILPPREALFRRDMAIYEDDGHTQRLRSQGPTASLKACIRHDDRKSLNRWLWAQDRYALLEVKKYRTTPFWDLGWSDRIRCVPGLAAPIVLVYCLILKGAILDGRAGWYYTWQRVIAELVLSLRLLERE